MHRKRIRHVEDYFQQLRKGVVTRVTRRTISVIRTRAVVVGVAMAV